MQEQLRAKQEDQATANLPPQPDNTARDHIIALLKKSQQGPTAASAEAGSRNG